MKLKDGMILTELDDSYIAVSSGETQDFRGIVKMNKTGAAIWELISEGCETEEIARRLVEKYDGVDYETALGQTKNVVALLKEKGLLTERLLERIR